MIKINNVRYLRGTELLLIHEMNTAISNIE